MSAAAPPVDVVVRPAVSADEDLLWEMLAYAAHADQGARGNPVLERHVRDWGRDGDLGVVAELGGEPVGAAWLRLLVGDEQATPAFVDEATPELVIAVAPEARGRAVGSAMLTRLLEAAASRYPRVTLNARADNPAIRLYERHGFTRLDEITNRVGTRSVRMLWVPSAR
ncbi:MAG: GNAT family N-acetyltransferase [Acidimicrobiia bacterium]